MTDRQKRIDKVQSASYNEAQRKIYTWVKQGVISFREFKELCEVNNYYNGG